MRIPYGFILASDGVLNINKDEADVISKLHDLYLFWNGFIHTGFDALHNSVFQFKPVRDSAAHVVAFSAA